MSVAASVSSTRRIQTPRGHLTRLNHAWASESTQARLCVCLLPGTALNMLMYGARSHEGATPSVSADRLCGQQQRPNGRGDAIASAVAQQGAAVLGLGDTSIRHGVVTSGHSAQCSQALDAETSAAGCHKPLQTPGRVRCRRAACANCESCCEPSREGDLLLLTSHVSRLSAPRSRRRRRGLANGRCSMHCATLLCRKGVRRHHAVAPCSLLDLTDSGGRGGFYL